MLLFDSYLKLSSQAHDTAKGKGQGSSHRLEELVFGRSHVALQERGFCEGQAQLSDGNGREPGGGVGGAGVGARRTGCPPRIRTCASRPPSAGRRRPSRCWPSGQGKGDPFAPRDAALCALRETRTDSRRRARVSRGAPCRLLAGPEHGLGSHPEVKAERVTMAGLAASGWMPFFQMSSLRLALGDQQPRLEGGGRQRLRVCPVECEASAFRGGPTGA